MLVWHGCHMLSPRVVWKKSYESCDSLCSILLHYILGISQFIWFHQREHLNHRSRRNKFSSTRLMVILIWTLEHNHAAILCHLQNLITLTSISLLNAVKKKWSSKHFVIVSVRTFSSVINVFYSFKFEWFRMSICVMFKWINLVGLN